MPEYTSEYEQYELCNFHPRETAERLDRALFDPSRAPKVVALRGEPGSGRRYLLEAARYRAEKQGSKVQLLELDLEGFEVDGQGLAAFAEHSLRERGLAPQRAGRLLKGLLQVVQHLDLGVFGAAVISLLRELDDPVAAFRELFRGEATPGPSLAGNQEVLRRVLRLAARDARVIVHVVRGDVLPILLLQTLAAESAREARLAVALSWPAKQVVEAVYGNEPELIDAGTLSSSEIAVRLDRCFRPNRFPSRLAHLLQQLTGGRPAELAARVLALLRGGGFRLEVEGWSLAPGGLDAPEVGEALTGGLFEPLNALLDERDDGALVRQFLALAALCGENVPGPLLLRFLAVSDTARDRVLDFVDDHLLSGALDYFRDLQYQHPSFGRFRQAIYRFRSPLHRRTLLEYLARLLPADAPERLLVFLDVHLPAVSEDAARIHLEVADRVPDPRPREAIRRRLSWWFGRREAEALESELTELVRSELLGGAVLLQVAQGSATWPPYRRLALLDACAAHPDGIPLSNAGLFHLLRALCYLDGGRFSEAIEEATLAAASFEQDDVRRIDAHVVESQACYFLGRFERGLALAVQAVRALRSAALRGHARHERLGTSIYLAGTCLSSIRRHEEAISHFEQAALEFREGDAHGRVSHDGLGASLHGVGASLSSLGRHEEAIPRLEEAVHEIRQGGDHGRVDYSGLGASIHRIGGCLSSLGRREEAIERYMEAVQERRKGDVHGRVDHHGLGESLRGVGSCLESLGRYGEAIARYEEAAQELRMGDVHGRVDHDGLGESLHGVGFCLSSLGRHEEAIPRYEEALQETRRGDFHGRVNHALLAASIHGIGCCLSSLGRPEEAIPRFEEAIREVREGDVHGRVDHRVLGLSIHQVGFCLCSLGRLEEAIARFQEAFEEIRRGDVRGRVDCDSLGLCCYQVGFSLCSLGRYEEAIPHFEEAIREMRKGDVHGRVDHQRIGASLNRIGKSYLRLGRHDQAREACLAAREEIARGSRTGLVDTRFLSTTIRRIGLCCARLGGLAAAEEWCREARGMRGGTTRS